MWESTALSGSATSGVITSRTDTNTAAGAAATMWVLGAGSIIAMITVALTIVAAVMRLHTDPRRPAGGRRHFPEDLEAGSWTTILGASAKFSP
jgi:hypothetical protein